MINSKNIRFSCVLDYSPLMAAQSYIWVSSLLRLPNLNPKDIYVHIIGEVPKQVLDFYEESEINIINCKPFDSRNRYCNKLVQLDTFSQLEGYDYVFLMDCDTAILSLENLILENEVYAKEVDFPSPSEEILKNIFKKANVNYKNGNSTFKINNNNNTEWNNCNGGVYIISRSFVLDLAKEWKRFSTWCIDNSALFTDIYSKHADQVGFALAMSNMDKKASRIGIEYNFPTHLGKNILKDVRPYILHYHDRINEHMQIKSLGLKLVDEQIEKINAIVSSTLEKQLNNTVFWNLRYKLYPDLGSGIGSRGEILNFKKNLLKYLTFGFENKLVVDVGCGDLELTKNFEFQNYIGLDVSKEALKIAKNKKPNWTFLNETIESDNIKKADLIMCFDVLIHQSSRESYESTIQHIVNKSTERIIIGAYNEPPNFNSQITYYYGRLVDEIISFKVFDEIAIVGKYRDVTVIVASKHAKTHHRDIESADLNKAFTEVRRPDLLRSLVDVSRYYFGFFTIHYPRVFEYTWVLERLENKNNKNVLDIGAGVSPLPICLVENGLNVTTIDSHKLVRTINDKEDWNEWGFLDYSEIRKNIKSRNVNFIKYRSLKKYDAIYSVSVIEHMPAQIRRKVLRNIKKLLKRGGELLLTIDLIPKTNNLWNFSEDKEVESLKEHGTIDALKDELRTLDFKIIEEEVQRDIKNSRTDIFYLKAIITKKGLFN